MSKYRPILIDESRGLFIQTAYKIEDREKDYADVTKTTDEDELGWILPGGRITTDRREARKVADEIRGLL